MNAEAERWLRRANIARRLELEMASRAAIPDAAWFQGWYGRMAGEAMARMQLEASGEYETNMERRKAGP